MKYCRMIALTGMIFQCLGCSIEQGDNPLTGLWKIYVIESQDSTGRWEQAEWMKDAIAYLHYDACSTMSLHFTPRGMWANDSIMALQLGVNSLAPQEEKEPYWYLANYEIIHEKQIVQHKRIIHSDPAEWGKMVERSYELTGDTLILKPLEYNLRLKWLREKKRGMQ